MTTPCFWLEPTDVAWRYLRRYTYQGDRQCSVQGWGHDAETRIEDAPLVRDAHGIVQSPPTTDVREHLAEWAHDPRWPTQCEHCGSYVFADDDNWQLFVEPAYRRTDTDAITTIRDAPPGAMWDAFWLSGPWERGPDGMCLVVKTPGHDWCVDGRASNCTLPDDKWDQPGHHYCWVRHNSPKDIPCHLHVDKNGKTCAAGAGSIQSGSYHGFLHDGALS